MTKQIMKKLLQVIVITFLLIATSTNTFTANAQNLILSLQTDKSSYILRELVQTSGTLEYDAQPVQGGLVGIEIRDPRATPQKIVARTAQVGTVPTSGWSVQVLSTTLCDFNGNPLTSTLRGINAFFKTTIKYTGAGSRQIRVTVNIFDNSIIPIGLLSAQFSVSTGDIVTAGPANIYIENSATPGVAPIYVNIFTDWPEDGGYPLCPEATGNFTILESQYESSPGNPLPTPFIQDGNYKMNFTLSSEPYPGTYLVDAVAWYQGWTDIETTTFSVTDVAAPPRASFVAKPPVSGPGYEVTFDASYSTAEGYGDTITSYSWKFGDTTTGSGKTVKHTYSNLGNYTVILNVTDNEGFWNTTSKIMRIAIVHNVAVISIQCLNPIYDRWMVTVSVTVKNLGTIPETFNVTLSANSSLIQTKQATNLSPQLTTVLTFDWNTTGIVYYANYFLTATIAPLVNETETSDNTLNYGPIYTKALGDYNNNREIDIFDLVFVVSRYGATTSSPNWDIMADLTRDGKIDIFDVVQVTSVYGKKY